MVFGGSMHPDQDDEFAWLEGEAEFLRATLADAVPVFGVCLGAQMLARAAGARVEPATVPEVGWFEIELTPEGRNDPVLGTLPQPAEAFLWHQYTFATPEGATQLARTAACTQSFLLGRSAWAIQFHAEMTLGMLEAWTAEEPSELPVSRDEFLAAAGARIELANEQGRALCEAFLDAAATARRAA